MRVVFFSVLFSFFGAQQILPFIDDLVIRSYANGTLLKLVAEKYVRKK